MPRIFHYIIIAFAISSQPCVAAKILNIDDFGIASNGSFDATLEIEAALKAAEEYTLTHTSEHVEVHFGPGRYELRRGMTIPSNVSVIGAKDGETIIYFNPPRSSWSQAAFGTRALPKELHYIAIARADDQRHSPIPGGSYRGLDFVYVHNLSDIAILRTLGVPSKPMANFAGLEVTIASGATLGNNRAASNALLPSQVSPNEKPMAQIAGEPGINPTPANVVSVVAADDDGRVTFAQHNRFDWGRDFHEIGETLDEYYDPQDIGIMGDGAHVPKSRCPECKSLAQNAFISGPGWIIPMNNYTHNISFENLIFEQDFDRPSKNVEQTYLLFLMYINGAVVRNCKFRHVASIYPILSVRGFNIDVDRSEFAVSTYLGIALDAGSGYSIRNSKFIGKPIAGAEERGLPPHAQYFIVYDEAPIDVSIVNNTFENLEAKTKEGKDSAAIFGTGGAFTKLLDNKFISVKGALFLNVFYNNGAVISGNQLHDSSSRLYSGTGASEAVVSHNIFFEDIKEAETRTSKSDISFDSYNNNEHPNFACSNRGLSIRQWYRGTTRFPGNSLQNGEPVRETMISKPLVGWPQKIENQAASNEEHFARIEVEGEIPVRPNTEKDITVVLSGPAASDFPFSLEISDGGADMAQTRGGAFVIPAGQSRLTLPQAFIAHHSGRVKLSARSLCTSTIERVSADVRIQ